ncbi:MAG: hypothetical protein E6J90_14195 [Deltaproteobacteria bacterium]|nr:MAG: hypothetical protein E6J90_14195 [Deltaproteobacteria bacterium]
MESAESGGAEIEHHVDHDHLARLVEPLVGRTDITLGARDRVGDVVLEPLGDLLGADLLADVIVPAGQEVTDPGGGEPARVAIHMIDVALVLGDEVLERRQVDTGHGGARSVRLLVRRGLAMRAVCRGLAVRAVRRMGGLRHALDLGLLSRRRAGIVGGGPAVRSGRGMLSFEAHQALLLGS